LYALCIPKALYAFNDISITYKKEWYRSINNAQTLPVSEKRKRKIVHLMRDGSP
jgi:hypothetical protein